MQGSHAEDDGLIRIIVTSDLHYNVLRSKSPTRAIARQICELGGDVLIFAGDTAGIDLDVLDEAFGLFEPFRGPRLALAGNHELWTAAGGDSLYRYENEWPAACSRNGVHALDQGPFVHNGLAIVGNAGWYDYTFRPAGMGVPLRFYQHKVAPGAAAYYAKHQHLLNGRGDVGSSALEITTRWMDGEHVRLPMSDVAFARRLASRLQSDLESVHDRAERIVAVTHHLPFAELLPRSIVPNWRFATAFMGSEVIGDVLLRFEKLRHVFCGHSHQARRCRRAGLECTSIGSTYREKQYEVLEI